MPEKEGPQMNITIKVDDVTLDTVVADVVGYDEDGDLIERGGKTVAHMVAEQITARLVKGDRWSKMADKVSEVRTEEIRAAVRPLIEEAISGPVRQTNSYGEPVGQETTLRALILEEVRKLMKEPADRYGRDSGTLLSKTIADEVQKAIKAEIADEVKKARDLVSGQIGQMMATAVQQGLKSR
jgi:hypothetical protein